MKIIRNFAVAICLFVNGSHAVSATININVSGNINGNYPSLPSIIAGDIWRAELTIDSDTTNAQDNSVSQGFYYGLTGNIYIGDTLVSHIGVSDGNQYPNYPYPVVLVENDHQSWKEDEINFFGYCCTSSPVEDHYVDWFTIRLRDSNLFGRESSHTNPFDSHELSEVLSVSSLAAFQDSTSDSLFFGMYLNNNDGEETAISGSITNYSASISSVPIPATIWLFGSGLLGLFGIARNNAKQ